MKYFKINRRNSFNVAASWRECDFFRLVSFCEQSDDITANVYIAIRKTARIWLQFKNKQPNIYYSVHFCWLSMNVASHMDWVQFFINREKKKSFLMHLWLFEWKVYIFSVNSSIPFSIFAIWNVIYAKTKCTTLLHFVRCNVQIFHVPPCAECVSNHSQFPIAKFCNRSVSSSHMLSARCPYRSNCKSV